MSETEEMHKMGGAYRQHKTPAYRLIPSILLKWAGDAFREGAEKYNEGLWETNWKKGNQQFYAEAFDHVIEHLYKWWTLKTDPAMAEVLNYEKDENHLGHAAAGLGFLMYGEVMGFFNEARDPSAPGYQYPFVPEDIPPEMQPTISDLIERGEEEAQAEVLVTEAPEVVDPNWFEKVVKKATGKLTLDKVE
jgi:hypothetical protein